MRQKSYMAADKAKSILSPINNAKLLKKNKEVIIIGENKCPYIKAQIIPKFVTCT